MVKSGKIEVPVQRILDYYGIIYTIEVSMS